MQILRIGDSGDLVIKLQAALGGLVSDGKFGPLTEKSVKGFQFSKGLTVDGIVGPMTWDALGIKFPENEPIKIPSAGETRKMIDVYHGDGIIDWVAVKADGIDAAMIKCTEGINMVDPMFHRNWEKARGAGIRVGAYHFFHPEEDATAQAEFFLNTMGPLDMDHEVPALDWEKHGGPIHYESANALIWLKHVEGVIGRRPWLYSYGEYINEVGNPSWASSYPLWLADYRSTPHIPRPWDSYIYWQYSDHETVKGIERHCDASIPAYKTGS